MTDSKSTHLPFSMSGDDKIEIHIPSVFMQKRHADTLRELLRGEEKVEVLLTWVPHENKSVEERGSEVGESVGEGERGGEKEREEEEDEDQEKGSSIEDSYESAQCSAGDCSDHRGSNPLFNDGLNFKSEESKEGD